jgi:RNA recognition motif-containing protein
MTEDVTGGLRPQYQTYTRQKCFVAYSEQAHWSVDLLSACEEVLSQPEYNLEIDYARKHFAADVPLLQKALELIANARCGIYDLSFWRQDEHSHWQMPRNVMIELGIAIALNRPILLLRHASNRQSLLPETLQGLSEQILEFSGGSTLKKILAEHLPKWIDTPPEKAWWNSYCFFGGRVCDQRETHPQRKQLGKKELACFIADGEDSCRPDFRSVVEDVLDRYSDVTYTYLNSLALKEGYNFLLCSHCQLARSSPFAIYRITPHTPMDAFISIGISIALEFQFKYKIPKVLIAHVQDVPSLLKGYEVCNDRNDRDRKNSLNKYIPEILRKTRQTSWKPRPLPFIELAANQLEEMEELNKSDLPEDSSNNSIGVYISNLPPQVTTEDVKEVFQEYGTVTQVDLAIDSKTGNSLGLALVEMMTASEAQKAFEELDKADWMGRTLEVKIIDFEKLTDLRIKFRRSLPRHLKVRIYELSKELNIDNKETLAICDYLNIVVKTHSSIITESEAQKIREAAYQFRANSREAARSTAQEPQASVKPIYVKEKEPVKQQILEIRRHRPLNSDGSLSNANVENSKVEPSRPSTLESQQKQNNSIYVGNLSFQVTMEDLNTVFSEYGKVIRVKLPNDRETGRPRGFAFVEMSTEAEANAAIEELDGAQWMGREMKVNKAKYRGS